MGWKDDLRQAAQSSPAEIFGIEKIVHRHHAYLVTTAIQAFGNDPAALFFVETLPASSAFPRPDLVMLHPTIGGLVIENKGVNLTDILAVEGHALTLNRDGMVVCEDPFFQAERVMYTLKDLIKTRIDQTEILLNRMAALPAIPRMEFEQKFHLPWGEDALFQEDLISPGEFRRRVLAYSQAEREKAHRPVFITQQASRLVAQILRGRGTLYSPRQAVADARDAHLLGNQIHAMETALKALTPQQVELMKLDVRGQHRLFRGVAGSGKSLLLSALAARLAFRSEDSSTLFEPAPPLAVLVVCFNRTLVHHLRGKIEEEYRRLAWCPATTQVPVKVRHLHGLLRELSDAEPSFQRWSDVDQDRPQHALAVIEAFNRLEDSAAQQLQYDAIFVDEAQDLEPEEIKLLLRLVKKDPAGNQTFVVFYDNAQNIYGLPTPVWESLSVNIVGRTTFMDRCMRNSREIVELAFNVLVGSFAPPQTRVTTRQFADVASLRNRDLIVEMDDRFAVNFVPRSGPMPEVRIFGSGREEREHAIITIRTLWREQKVLPSDILILYPSHTEFDALKEAAFELLADEFSVRSVDRANDAEKNLPLIQDRTMTLCTVHSAKGYDAPVVILLGADLFSNDTEGRAAFYVAATRAKMKLYVFGVKTPHRPAELLTEIAAASAALSGERDSGLK